MSATLPELFAQRAILVERLEELTPRLREVITEHDNAQYDFKVAYAKLEEVDHQIRKIVDPRKQPFWKKIFGIK